MVYPKRRRSLLLFLGFWFLQISVCLADSSSICVKPQLHFRQLLEELSQSNVRNIVQDSLGFIWMGTTYGLNRFDGVYNKIYRKEDKDPNSLRDDRVTDLFIDSQNHLWIATYRNLLYYNYEREHFEVIPNPVKDLDLDALVIVEDRHKTLWVGTHHGLYQLDTRQNTLNRPKSPHLKPLIKTEIFAMMEDKQGMLWLGTHQGIYLVSPDRKLLHKLQFAYSSLNQAKINAFLQDKHGNIWVATEQAGLFKLKEKGGLNFDLNPYLQTRNISEEFSISDTKKILSLYQDSYDRIWVGTEKDGLLLYCNELDDFFNYKKDPRDDRALKTNSIWEIFEDNDGRIWLGSNNQGAFIYDPFLNTFQLTTKGSGDDIRLKFSTVTSFLEFDDIMWIGTDGGGISVWDRKKNTYNFINHQPGNLSTLGSDEVLVIFRDRDGIVWTGNWEGGLNRFEPKDSSFFTFTHQKNNPNSLGSNSIFGIDEAENGDLWMSTWGHGITRYRKSDNSFFNIPFVQYNPDFISSPHTYDVEIDDLTGDIWLGSVLGIQKIRMKNDLEYTIEHIQADKNTSPHLSSAFVQCIYEDSKNRIWVGTDNGLNLYDRKKHTFIKFLRKHGLPGKAVKSVIEDDSGNLWISTSSGIAKLHQEKGSWVFSKFDKSDGLQGKEFFWNAAYKARSGKIFFGGVNGLNYFMPNQIRDNPNAPKIQLLEFKLFNKEVKINREEGPLKKSITLMDEVVLNHKQFVFTIEYQGVHFTKPGQNQYAYKMEGFEKEWNYVGNRTSATYTNLDPGRYTFLVKCANHQGVWSSKVRKLRIVILPVWWKTWWAQSLVYFILILVPFAVYWIRLSVVRKQKVLLEKVVEERTAKVLAQKNELEIQAGKLRELNQQKNKLFSIIAHDLRSPLATLMATMQLVNPKMLRAEDLDMIKKDINRRVKGISEVIDDLLHWAKGQMDGESTQRERFDLHEIGEEMLGIYEDRAQQKGIDLQNKLNPGTWALADKNHIRVVFRNLIANAIKYTEEQDTVCLASFLSQEGYLTLQVSDTGIGMGAEQAQELFSPRKSLSKTGTSGEHGFGLGLMLVKEYIEKNKGQIWVKSSLGQGTCFYFTLPRAEHEIAVSPLKS